MGWDCPWLWETFLEQGEPAQSHWGCPWLWETSLEQGEPAQRDGMGLSMPQEVSWEVSSDSFPRAGRASPQSHHSQHAVSCSLPTPGLAPALDNVPPNPWAVKLGLRNIFLLKAVKPSVE